MPSSEDTKYYVVIAVFILSIIYMVWSWSQPAETYSLRPAQFTWWGGV